MGLPLTAMITEDQSLPCVQDWIARFRHAEKNYWVITIHQDPK